MRTIDVDGALTLSFENHEGSHLTASCEVTDGMIADLEINDDDEALDFINELTISEIEHIELTYQEANPTSPVCPADEVVFQDCNRETKIAILEIYMQALAHKEIFLR